MSDGSNRRPLGERHSEGQRLLARFLREKRISIRSAATKLGVSWPTVHDWVWARKSPAPDNRDGIEVWSRGVVPASSWETSAERERRLELEGRPSDPNGKAA